MADSNQSPEEGSSHVNGALHSLFVHDGGLSQDFAIRLMKAARVELKLPKESIQVMRNDFQILELSRFPKVVGEYHFSNVVGQPRRILNTYKVVVDNNILMFKYCEGEGLEAKLIVKEVCLLHHLKELEGVVVPKLLAYGVPNALGAAGFFAFLEHYDGDIIGPSQVSSIELKELLHKFHSRGVLLGCENDFPRLIRHRSGLLVIDLSTAQFEQKKSKLRKEYESLAHLGAKE